VTKLKFSERTYEMLTAEERLRAVLENLARGNGEEVNRLVSRCPREFFVGPYREFRTRFSVLATMTLFTAWILSQEIRKLTLGLFAEYALGLSCKLLVNRLEEDKKVAKIKNDADKLAEINKAIDKLVKYKEEIRVLAEEVAKGAAGTWEGFGSFCENEIGISPETVLRAMCPEAIKDYKGFSKYLKGVEPDPKKKEQMYMALKSLWTVEVTRGII